MGFFDGLFGNGKIKLRIAALLENNTLPHAFLIVGPSGSGKRTFALELAAALNCENNGKGGSLPCHKCTMCKRIRENNFADIMRLKRQGSKATIGVEEVRDFREDMFLSATESQRKIYIIEEADKLTVNAQNALLTVLEEPPTNLVIMLLCESADKILTTIKSRAQTIAMERFSDEALKELLIANNERARLYSKTDTATLDGIIMASDGRIGRAFSLLSDGEARENNENREVIEKIVSALKPSRPYSELYLALGALPTSRGEFCEALELIMSALRDISLIKFDKNLPLLFYTSRETAKEASREIKTKRLFAIYELIAKALQDASRNVGVFTIISELGAKIKML